MLHSIRSKLIALFVFGIVLVAGIGLFALYSLTTVNDASGELRSTWLPKIEAAATIKRLMITHNLLARRRLQTTDFRQQAAINVGMNAASDELDRLVAEYRQGITASDEQSLLEALVVSWPAYLDSYARNLRRLETGAVSAALNEFESLTVTQFDESTQRLEALVAFAEAGTDIARQRAEAAYSAAAWVLAGVFTAAVFLAIAMMIWVSRRISDPLRRVADAMRRLSQGDEDAIIPTVGNRHDEIGTLQSAASDYRQSVVRIRELADIANTERNRLHAAIANMPIGFCMYDKDDKLILCNDRFAELYKLPKRLTKPGASYDEVNTARIKADTYAGDDPDAFRAGLAKVRRAGKLHHWVWDLKDGRSISTTYQPVSGGWIAIHEDISYRKAAEEQIRHMARHDPLTDLPNRSYFSERLEEALKRVDRGEGVAVLYFDLDRFKNVNDSLGHPLGDALLQEVAKRLSAEVRETDTAGRLGGDEFAVVQAGVEQPPGVTRLAQRLIDKLSAPYVLSGNTVSVGVSVGIALPPGDGDSAEELLKKADMALYRAKNDGRGVYRFFEPDMDARMQNRRQLEIDMREAMKQKQFELHYQPLIELSSGQVTCFEALLRWKHAERGNVPPTEFIPVAEEVGLIDELGRWVLRRACTDASAWPANIKVAVNLSPAQFRNGNLAATVMMALRDAKLDSGRLELEITEGVLLENTDRTLEILHQVRTLGVRIALDDFGTGYSSLSYLRSFPFDKIKIDRSFIHTMTGDANSLAIVRAVAGLGTSLGMGTTAEGVETDEQLSWLRREGCSEVQGYLFSPARPASEVPALIKKLHGSAFAA